ELLLHLEALPIGMYGAVTISPDSPKIAVEGYNEEAIAYHLSLLQERGLIEVPDGQPMIGIVFTRLTWEGHDFLDAVRDPEIWQKTKQGADAIGSFSFDLVKQLAIGLIKTKIEEHTGVKL
ncbi:MAG TPA: DUF2513 domain-containing protein, partial [Pseudolabrys sp.]|nr:DUF2513 domain-containing protein [Pseudolabrys sp.]